MADTPDFSQMSDSDLQSIVSGGQQSQDQQQTPSLQNMSNDQLMSIVGSAPVSYTHLTLPTILRV